MTGGYIARTRCSVSDLIRDAVAGVERRTGSLVGVDVVEGELRAADGFDRPHDGQQPAVRAQAGVIQEQG